MPRKKKVPSDTESSDTDWEGEGSGEEDSDEEVSSSSGEDTSGTGTSQGSETSDSEESSEEESDDDEESPKQLRLTFTPDRVPRPISDSNRIFRELIKNQIPDVPRQWKLNIDDMRRICRYVTSSIFDRGSCCLWKGYVTNANNTSKGTYVNFYFGNKKVALHRLLYSNYVAPLDSTEYLKFNCENKGVCCNVHHYEKYRYSKTTATFRREPKKEVKKDSKDTIRIGCSDPRQLFIDFE